MLDNYIHLIASITYFSGSSEVQVPFSSRRNVLIQKSQSPSKNSIFDLALLEARHNAQQRRRTLVKILRSHVRALCLSPLRLSIRTASAHQGLILRLTCISSPVFLLKLQPGFCGHLLGFCSCPGCGD